MAQLAVRALSRLVANGQFTDTSQLLGKDVKLEVTKDGLGYEPARNRKG